MDPFLAAPRPRLAALRAFDARVALLLALLFGALVWRAGLAGNLAYGALFAAVLVAAGATRADARRLARSAAAFALLWASVKLALDLGAGLPARGALASAALLSVRLGALLLMGAALGALVTPRALGLALASLVRPVLGRRAWTAALAVSLMVHFIPRALAAFEGARRALRVRRVRVSRTRALVLVSRAGARNLAGITWDQTLAIAARRLDGPEAWAAAPPPRPRDWLAGIGVAALAVGAALL